MDGISGDWVDAGSSREASFPALPHGRYRFRVAASTDGLQWVEAQQALEITVRPQVWQTPWFIALALLAGAAAIAGLVGLRTRSLQARQAEMERLVAQRTEELRQANEHLARLSFVDSLTGLANRRRFDEALQEEWRRARRNQASLALVIADIDGFKRYNDRLGHLEGDRCLQAVAAVFGQTLGRAGDLAARYGGEEFIVLLPGADGTAALQVAETLRARCEALAIPHPDSPSGPLVTLSLGVAACLPSVAGASVEDLMARADAALYRAKQGGRNRVAA
jgi:diguanylate cyclase (GGDEF)-like protein